MAILALVFLAAFLALQVLNGWRLRRRTGYNVLRSAVPRRRLGSMEWLSGRCVGAAYGCLVVGPVLDVTGVRLPELRGWPWHVAGIVLALVGIAGVYVATADMGDAWRLAVIESERTRLVTNGLFRYVRNPLFAAMVVAVLGLALMVPNVVAWAAVPLLVIGLELQVRKWEEPYLLRVHGGEWATYASKVGRFVPRIGRLRVR